MEYKTRKLIRPEDLNSRGTVFGGTILKWIDEEAAIYAMCQLKAKNIVTKLISEINFMSPGYQGDVIEIGVDVVSIGESSITLTVDVRNKDTENSIVKVDKIIFVSVGKDGKSTPHYKVDDSAFKSIDDKLDVHKKSISSQITNDSDSDMFINSHIGQKVLNKITKK
jgi:acyl-CoA thioesterase YciA